MVGWIYKRCTNDKNLYRGVAVFESRTRTWTTSNVLHPSQVDSLGLKMRFEEVVVLKETLYCQTMNHSIPMDNLQEIGLMTYNMQAKVWHNCIYIISLYDQQY